MAEMLPDTVWRCYGHNHRQHENSSYLFMVGENLPETCPVCGSEDIFPFRMFKCTACGVEGDQDEFFPDSDADIHPLEETDMAECPNCCFEDEEVQIIQIPVPSELIGSFTTRDAAVRH